MLWLFRKELQQDPSSEARLEVLHRAAVVLIAACWESYIEDVATEAFDYLLDRAPTPDTFPAKVKVLASKELFEERDARRIWQLVTGWKDLLQAHRDEIVTKSLKGFNTPKTRQVKELFSDLLDLDVTSNWVWKDMTFEQAGTLLDEHMIIRGNIAHRTRHSTRVQKRTAKAFLKHVALLVEKTDETVEHHLRRLTGEAPWPA
jgi:hypothetical protein